MATAKQFEFHPKGYSRYFDLVFLSTWLVGWLAGELFALAALFAVVAKLFNFNFFKISGSFNVGLGLFLFIWLSFWSLGGYAALFALLRSFGVQRVFLSQQALTVEEFHPFFKRTYTFSKNEILAPVSRANGGGFRLKVKSKNSGLTLAHFAKTTEQTELVRGINEILSLRQYFESRNLEAPEKIGQWLRVENRGRVFVLRQDVLMTKERFEVSKRQIVHFRKLPLLGEKVNIYDASLTIDDSVDSEGDKHFALFIEGTEGKKEKVFSQINDFEEVLYVGNWLSQVTELSLHLSQSLKQELDALGVK